MIDTEYDFHVIVDPDIFNDAYIPMLDNMSRVQILFGGSSSGKSVFKSQDVVIDLMNGGRNYLICRAVGKTLKHSVFNEVKRRISEFGVNHLFKINESDFTIKCVNGYVAYFVGLDDVEKIKSIVPPIGVFTDIWIEEATEVDKKTVKNLMKRQRGGDEDTPKRLTLTFNPILQDHWIFDEYFKPISWTDKQTFYTSSELTILKTWFQHNKFLTQQDKDDLLNEEDKYFSDVYTWGNWGVLGNVIFTNWTIEDLSDKIRYFDNHRNGLDFGFADAPTALGRSHWDKKHQTIYVFEELYETDLMDDDLATECINMCGNELITADSAEPKTIKTLKSKGVNIIGAKKGKGSINFGIKWLQSCKIVVHKSCINAQNELRQYKWKEDMGGKIIHHNGVPVPIDKNNHFIDGGLRYAYEGDMVEINKRGRQWAG